LTDQHDHLLGYAVVIRDVTARLTRQQRLEVFNRVLRHNLRNDVNVIYGHSELIRSRTDDEVIDNSAETILQTGQELIALSKEAQEADNILNIEETTEREISLAPLIDDVLAAVTTACPRLTSSHDVSDDLVVAAQEKPLRLALTHLVENAIEHNDSEDPEVRVSASYTPDEQYPLCISIADNGPGIPVKERRTIETGSETPLQHSTGIGLWIVRWVTTALGGELEFAERDPWGTIVSLNLPTAHYDRNATESPPEPGSE
jgi:signal transduction histidine kinase